jgi:hypothetical protein
MGGLSAVIPFPWPLAVPPRCGISAPARCLTSLTAAPVLALPREPQSHSAITVGQDGILPYTAVKGGR